MLSTSRDATRWHRDTIRWHRPQPRRRWPSSGGEARSEPCQACGGGSSISRVSRAVFPRVQGVVWYTPSGSSRAAQSSLAREHHGDPLRRGLRDTDHAMPVRSGARRDASLRSKLRARGVTATQPAQAVCESPRCACCFCWGCVPSADSGAGWAPGLFIGINRIICFMELNIRARSYNRLYICVVCLPRTSKKCAHIRFFSFHADPTRGRMVNGGVYLNHDLNPFPAGLVYTQVGGMPRVAGRPDSPCDPRALVQSLWGPRRRP